MTQKELYEFLDKKIPKALSADWDNDGVACMTGGAKKVRRVLVALDATETAVKRAVEGQFDVLLTHHPLLFRGVSAITEATTRERKLTALIKNDVACFSFHTRLDAVEGGVNDALCGRLDITETEPFGPVGEVPCGRVGHLKTPVSSTVFARRAAAVLGADDVTVSGAGIVSRVAVLGGEGDDYVAAAAATGADLFLSGHIGYHRMLDYAEEGMTLVSVGHYESEAPVCAVLADLVRQADNGIEVEVMSTKAIFAVKGE
jgi:dinuclear metal center YbgI/SA1388 family protein